MRVLVTGSTGFVGSDIAARLREEGHTVVGASRRSATNGDVSVDLRDVDVVRKILEGVEPCGAIVHAAASLNTDPDASSISLANCWGTQAVLAVARAWSVARVVYISSIGVIGSPVTVPITEDHPTVPTTTYHASKLFGEYLVRILATEGIPAASLRISSPVGQAMPGRRIFSVFVERAMRCEELVITGRGTRRQNFVDTRDVSGAVIQCIERGSSGTFNIGGPAGVSNVELARTCVDVLGSSSLIRFSGADPADGSSWDVSWERAAQTFGYLPKYSLAESIRSIAGHIS